MPHARSHARFHRRHGGLAAVGLAGLTLGGGVLLGAVPQGQDTIARLLGRWAGNGSVTPVSGPAEPFRCVVTYRSGSEGAMLQQNLRCQGANHSLDAATHLNIANGQVTGTWEERLKSLGGEVMGKVTPTGFDVYLSGRFFEAQLVVAGTGCTQDVKLTPLKAEVIRELSATLRKC